MKFSDARLPSNKKFGLFFTFVFALLAVYFYTKELISWTLIMSLVSLSLLVLSIVKAKILLPLNKLWMKLGLILSIIVSPIILGAIFFGIFTPVALLMRFIRRDELRLKFYKKSSHWIARSEQIKSESFKQQF